MRYNLTDISRTPLSDTDLADVAIEALNKAREPGIRICDCPWDLCGREDRAGRYRRVVWRTVFRTTREATAMRRRLGSYLRRAA